MKPYISSYIYEQSLNQETLQCHIKDQVRSFQLHSDKQLQPYFLLFVVVSLKKLTKKHCHPCQSSVYKMRKDVRCANSQSEQRIQIKPTEDFLVSLTNATLLFFLSEITQVIQCVGTKNQCVFKLKQEQNNITGRIKQCTVRKGHISTLCERALIFQYSIEKSSLNSPCHRILNEISSLII